MPKPGWAKRQAKKSEEDLWNLPWWQRRLLLLKHGQLGLYLVPVGAHPYFNVGVLEESAECALRRYMEWNETNRRMPGPLALPYVKELKVPNVSQDDTIRVLRHLGIMVLDGKLE